jgi:ABC-2 type transport system permease protein
MPALAQLTLSEQWRERLYRLAPMSSGLAIQATRRLDTLPIGPWAGLGVLTGYAAVALTIGAMVFHRPPRLTG